MATIGNGVFLSDKNKLTNATQLPIAQDRFIVLSETRELYYDDGTYRFKVRDIQVLDSDSNRSTCKKFNNDLYFINATKSFWYYVNNAWVQISGTTEHTITGDGTTKSFTITHTFNKRNVIVQVVDSSYETVYPDITRSTVSTVTVGFNTAPANNTVYKVIITG